MPSHVLTKYSIVKEAFLAGTQDQGLILIKNRLENRQTYCEYNKTIMGPIKDKLGVEQGGKNSDRYFRLCGNNQLKSAQRSGLGSNLLEGLHVAAIGQADDTSSHHQFTSSEAWSTSIQGTVRSFMYNLCPRKQDFFHSAHVHRKTQITTTEQLQTF